MKGRGLRQSLRGRAVAWAIPLIVALVSCNGATPDEGRGLTLTSKDKPAEEGQALADCEGAPAPDPSGLIVASPPREVLLFLDGSGSMRGFAEQQDRYAAVLSGLRPVLLDLEVENSKVIWVGSGLQEQQDHRGGFGRYDSKEFYRLPETNLAKALDEAQKVPRGTLTLVLSDGVMSLSQDTGDRGKLPDCERGSDIHCLAYKLQSLVQSGRGFWVVGLRSAFRGPLYSELLKPGGASLGEVDLPNRPFYLWVISSHPPSARALISKLLARIGAKTDKAAFALEVAPGYLPWKEPNRAVAPSSDSRLFPKGARSGAASGRFVPPSGRGVGTQTVVSGELNGTAFGMRIPLASTSLSVRSDGIGALWEYRPSYCLRWEGRTNKAVVRTNALEEDGQLHISILAQSFQRLGGRRATVMQKLTRESQAAVALPDMGAWSTSDDSKSTQGSRTLHLDEFLYALQERLHLRDVYEQPLLTLKFE